MKNKLLLLIAMVFIGHFAVAQTQLKPADDFIHTLQQKEIDTILVYKNICTDCMVEVNKPDCHCLDSVAINEVYIIYQKMGKTYRVDFSCCDQNAIAFTNCKSIPYFVSLQKTLLLKANFYKSHLLQLLPTEKNAFDETELIVNNHHIQSTSYFYQRHNGHEFWEKYFWVDKEIKLVNLVRQDLGLISN